MMAQASVHCEWRVQGWQQACWVGLAVGPAAIAPTHMGTPVGGATHGAGWLHCHRGSCRGFTTLKPAGCSLFALDHRP
jgi:hypothetical protein